MGEISAMMLAMLLVSSSSLRGLFAAGTATNVVQQKKNLVVKFSEHGSRGSFEIIRSLKTGMAVLYTTLRGHVGNIFWKFPLQRLSEELMGPTILRLDTV
jgi:hypothetical protein